MIHQCKGLEKQIAVISLNLASRLSFGIFLKFEICLNKELKKTICFFCVFKYGAIENRTGVIILCIF